MDLTLFFPSARVYIRAAEWRNLGHCSRPEYDEEGAIPPRYI